MDERYNYDEKSDSPYIPMRDGEEEKFEEIVPGINVELDKNNKIIGIEVLKASRSSKGIKKSIELSS
jgi:uncharacterized protein YuzE